ncbi:MAG: choice-of-anchor L domain-containing protein, partial [Candidatus Kapabacteria bacterium]|nr:choice-of-anchor L domain-containing protein [Candidatus Kapabacteria bacterium]
IPTGSGTETNINTNYQATGLAPTTQYEYYVRADCGDGTFSAWTGPFLFNTNICEVENQCLFTFNMTDTFGDGWNGNTMTISQNGINIQTITLSSGSSGSVQVPLCDGIPFTLFWNTGGSFSSEVGVSVVTPYGETVYTKPASGADASSPGNLLYTGPVNCTPPTCPRPLNLQVSMITDSSATLSWTEIGSATQWQIIVLPTGSDFPDGTEPGIITTTENPYNYTGLSSLVQYTFYIRSVCEDDDLSDWSFVNFSTQPNFCAGDHFYDSGGPDQNYPNGANQTTTICNPNPDDYLVVTFNTFNLESGWDFLRIYDGPNATSPQIGPTAGFTGTTLPPMIISSGACLTFVFTSDTIINAAGWDATILCTSLTCPPPSNLTVSNITQHTADLSWQAGGDETQWEVIILPAGSPAPDADTEGIITSDNPYIATDLPSGASLVFYVRAICEDEESFWMGPRNFATLITNDECADAIPVPVNPDANCVQTVSATIVGATASAEPNTCGGTDDDDVWFEFVATSTSHIIDLINVVGSTTDLYHVLYQGDECGNLTQLYCSDPNQSTANNLVPGQTYKIRVYSWTGTPNQTTTFDVCVGTIPPPIYASTTDYTVEELVTDILLSSTCATVSNITYSTGSNFGSTNGIGYFNKNGSTFNFEDGIILSTGNAANAQGPNSSTLSDGSANTTTWGGDADLQAILAAQGVTGILSNATKLEFDFIPVTNTISFNFIFASEEYGTFQCSYSDVFAFLLTDLTTGVTTNLAVIPGTNIPVSVTTIRNQLHNTGCSSANPEYFGQYYGLPNGLPNISAPTNFNGLTIPMTAFSEVIPGNQYHIKLAITDYGPSFADGAFDSAVFIEGGSFNIGNVDLGDDFLISQGNAVCPNEEQLLDTNLNSDDYTFIWFDENGVIEGETGSSYLVVSPGVYTVQIQFLNSDCTGTDSVVVEFFDTIEPGEPNDLYFCSATGFGVFDLTSNEELILEPLGINYILSYHLTEEDAQNNENALDDTSAYTNLTNPQTIFVRVQPTQADCFNIVSFELVVEDLTPQFDLTEDLSICEGSTGVIEVTPINYDENSGVIYSWTLNGEPYAGNSASIEVTEEGVYEVLVDFGGCTNSAITLVIVESSFIPIVSFSYDADEYCQNGVNPVITLAGDFTLGGIFSST